MLPNKTLQPTWAGYRRFEVARFVHVFRCKSGLIVEQDSACDGTVMSPNRPDSGTEVRKLSVETLLYEEFGQVKLLPDP